MSSGDTLLVFKPEMNQPPATVPATLDWRNLHPVLDFDPDADEYGIWSAVMPQAYSDATGVTVFVTYTMSSAVSPATLAWQIAFERTADPTQNVDTDAWGAVTAMAATAVPATTAGLPKVVSQAVTKGTNMDSVVAGDLFRFRINRDISADNAANDAELHSVEIRET